jgi:hypothetical protein
MRSTPRFVPFLLVGGAILVGCGQADKGQKAPSANKQANPQVSANLVTLEVKGMV